jgi:hypothetical protein
VRCDLDSTGSGLSTMAGSCGHGNKSSGFLRGGRLFDQLGDCHLLHKKKLCSTEIISDFIIYASINLNTPKVYPSSLK